MTCWSASHAVVDAARHVHVQGCRVYQNMRLTIREVHDSRYFFHWFDGDRELDRAPLTLTHIFYHRTHALESASTSEVLYLVVLRVTECVTALSGVPHHLTYYRVQLFCSGRPRWVHQSGLPRRATAACLSPTPPAVCVTGLRCSPAVHAQV